jgi:hypothetical protein
MNQLRVVKSLNNGIEVLHRQHFSLYREVGSVLFMAGPGAPLQGIAKYFGRLGWTVGEYGRSFKKGEVTVNVWDASRRATNGVATDGSKGTNIILALSSFATSLSFFAQLTKTCGGSPAVILAPCGSPEVGADGLDYRIENKADVNGKIVVGLLVTDEGGWKEPFGSLTKQVGRDHWGPGIVEYNKTLALRGEAIEIAIVESKKGYLAFMPISSSVNAQLKIFMAVFHGSGVKDHEKIRIGRDIGWSVDDIEGGEMGFRAFNRRNLTKKARENDYSTYCAPSSGEYRIPMPLAAFKHLLE